MTALTIMMTHSRGGFLALGAGAFVLAWRARNRVAALSMLTILGLAGVLMAPASYVERIQLIANYEEDASSRARLKAWSIAQSMIVDRPLFGVGFGGFEREYSRFDPEEEQGGVALKPGEAHVAHNSYLQIWAECGSLAFILYLVLVMGSFWDLRRIRKEASQRYHSSWILNYATMFEASLVTFVVGSMFLNRAHFDLFYHWVALVVAFTVIARRHLAESSRYPTRGHGGQKLRRVGNQRVGVFRSPGRASVGGGS
jgi:probable O-glycosylation ligase (exosortase A-associated)